MELPVTVLSVIPAIVNIYLVVMPYQTQAKLFKADSKWMTLYYFVACVMIIVQLSFAFMFLTILLTFQYSYRGYYPSVGWCTMQLYLLIVATVNFVWWLSFTKLVYDLRKHFN